MQVMTDDELRNTNPVVALLRTLLPWVHIDDDAEQQQRPPAQDPEIPANLWNVALSMFPDLVAHLESRSLLPDDGGDFEDYPLERQREIGRAMAAFLLNAV